ncbi:MAG: hypothetical protein LQ352_000918 [Teloschistes flavicans]|nr:MAG: hypothetical protein LQ352_000918 [Teloschistes flavicans]
MSQATRSIRNTLSATSLRSNDPILRPRPADQHGNISTPIPAWRALVQDEGDAPSRPSDSVPDLRAEDRSRDAGPARSRTGAAQPIPQGGWKSSRYNHRVPSALNPPSAAAVSRAASSTPYQRPSGYSRSAIPDPEYDYFQRRQADNRPIRYHKNEYKPGMIIRAPLHEQDSKGGQHRPNGTGSSVATMASEATKAEKYTTESRFGTIFTKYRKMIVVALHQDNYVAVPMYTHNGMGLVNKARPDEFVSVKDHRDRNDAHWQQLSKWDPLVTEHLKDGIDLFDPRSTVHVAYPVSRRYALPVVLEGNLRRSSFKILKDLYGRFANVEELWEPSLEKEREWRR